MDLYPWIVFLHVVGVLLFFIAHGTSMAVGFRLKRERDPARVRALLELTDRKSLLALRGVGRQSEAESVRFHGRRVTRVGPEVKHGPEGWGPRNKGCERRTWALPDVSGGGERHDRFGIVVGEGSSSHESRVVSPGGSVPEQDGQNQRPLQEKANRPSSLQ